MACGDPHCPRHKDYVCPHGIDDGSIAGVCGYYGAWSLCGLPEDAAAHVSVYGAESFDRHRFRKGTWSPDG